jgi:hypothetical protein
LAVSISNSEPSSEVNVGFWLTEVRAQFLGHQIAAVYEETQGARLYIDGQIVDTSNKYALPSRKVPRLRGRVNDDANQPHVVEVYVRGFFYTRIRICIDGERVAGY